MAQHSTVPTPAVFTFQDSHKIRTITIDDAPWFVVKDVCDVLAIPDARQAAMRLDEDDRCLTTVTDSMGRNQKTYIANESGLYCLILRSKKPEAKKFKRWITSEVLPAIRKNGCYTHQSPAAGPSNLPPHPLTTGQTPAEAVQRINSAMDVLLGGEASREVLRHIYGNYLTVNELGTILGINEFRVNVLLLDLGYQVNARNGYNATGLGERYACYLNVDGYWDDKSRRQIIKWHSSIIPLLTGKPSTPKRGPIRRLCTPRPLHTSADTAVKAITAELQMMSKGEQEQFSCELYRLIAQNTASRLDRGW